MLPCWFGGIESEPTIKKIPATRGCLWRCLGIGGKEGGGRG